MGYLRSVTHILKLDLTSTMNSALIVENEPLICSIYQNILKALFNEGEIPYHQVHIASNTDTALAYVLESQGMHRTLNFCVLDYGMGSGLRLESAKSVVLGLKIKALFPNCKILMTSAISDGYVLQDVLGRLNPEGFLIKSDIDIEALKRHIVAVLEGQMVYGKKVTQFIRESSEILKDLDDRDLKIIQFMDVGLSLSEIADRIGLSLSGVEYRKRRIARNLGATSSNIPELLHYVRTELNLF